MAAGVQTVYALEVLRTQVERCSRKRVKAPALEKLHAFVAKVSQAFTQTRMVCPPVGLGYYEIPKGRGVRGFALVYDGHPYHVVAFVRTQKRS